MDIIGNFGVVKKNHTYLYENFDDTMSVEFRKLKGRFYKKTNHWVFPFVVEEVEEEVSVKETESVKSVKSVSTVGSQIEKIVNISIGIQTDEEMSNRSTDSKSTDSKSIDSKSTSSFEVEDDNSSLQTKSSSTSSEICNSDEAINDSASEVLSSTLGTNSSNSVVEIPKYEFKPPIIFYHQVSDYF
jgi:hypothetical protein